MKRILNSLILMLLILLTGCGEASDSDKIKTVKGITFNNGKSVEELIFTSLNNMGILSANSDKDEIVIAQIEDLCTDESIQAVSNTKLIPMFILESDLVVPKELKESDIKYVVEGKTNNGFIIKATDTTGNYAKIPVTLNGDYYEVKNSDIKFYDSKNTLSEADLENLNEIRTLVKNYNSDKSAFIYNNFIKGKKIDYKMPELIDIYTNDPIYYNRASTIFEDATLFKPIPLEDYIVSLMKAVSYRGALTDEFDTTLDENPNWIRIPTMQDYGLYGNSELKKVNYYKRTMKNVERVLKGEGIRAYGEDEIPSELMRSYVNGQVKPEILDKYDITKADIAYEVDYMEDTAIIYAVNKKTNDKIEIATLHNSEFTLALEKFKKLVYILNGDRYKETDYLAVLLDFGNSANDVLAYNDIRKNAKEGTEFYPSGRIKSIKKGNLVAVYADVALKDIMDLPFIGHLKDVKVEEQKPESLKYYKEVLAYSQLRIEGYKNQKNLNPSEKELLNQYESDLNSYIKLFNK